MVIAFVLAVLLPEIPLSDLAGIVASGEAVNEELTTPTGAQATLDPTALDPAMAATSDSIRKMPVDDESARNSGASR